MCKWMIGIDGGGTKTEFVLFTEHGEIVKQFVLEGCNPNNKGISYALRVLKSGLDSLFAIQTEVAGVFIGSSGFASGGQGKQIEKELALAYPNVKFRCESDVYNLVACSSDPSKCIAVICGTGSVVYANENGILRRFGGGGFLIDKGGSGYHIGRDALYQALYERDGVAMESLITDMVEKQLGMDVWSAIGTIYQREQAYIASFAPLVFDAYARGDVVAEEILERNAECLASLICGANQCCDAGNVVILSGSVLTKTDVFLTILKSKISAHLRIEILSLPQVYGACAMCCKMCGVDEKEMKNKFIKQYDEIAVS